MQITNKTLQQIFGISRGQALTWTKEFLGEAGIQPAKGTGSSRIYSVHDVLGLALVDLLVDKKLSFGMIKTIFHDLNHIKEFCEVYYYEPLWEKNNRVCFLEGGQEGGDFRIDVIFYHDAQNPGYKFYKILDISSPDAEGITTWKIKNIIRSFPHSKVEEREQPIIKVNGEIDTVKTTWATLATKEKFKFTMYVSELRFQLGATLYFDVR
ncbi:MAG: MerR family transcriptional regulator [Candidatus Schekmanbacteria bacterium]|nr:MerR family transcriptional regulator [Candidatus Schekmanbacteria bacterium]